MAFGSVRVRKEVASRLALPLSRLLPLKASVAAEEQSCPRCGTSERRPERVQILWLRDPLVRRRIEQQGFPRKKRKKKEKKKEKKKKGLSFLPGHDSPD